VPIEWIVGVAPTLAGNPAVSARGSQNVIRVVLGGLEATHGLAPMPAVGVAMSDSEIAAVVNYVQSAWGNNAPADSGPGLVADLRSRTHTLMAVNLPDACPAIADAKLASAVAKFRIQSRDVNETQAFSHIDAILPEIKKSGASDDDVVNTLTAAYFSVLMADTTLSAGTRASLLGNFSNLAYGHIKSLDHADRDTDSSQRN
jgi:hypothetical protein